MEVVQELAVAEQFDLFRDLVVANPYRVNADGLLPTPVCTLGIGVLANAVSMLSGRLKQLQRLTDPLISGHEQPPGLLFAPLNDRA